jgi:hypothetical protein
MENLLPLTAAMICLAAAGWSISKKYHGLTVWNLGLFILNVIVLIMP